MDFGRRLGASDEHIPKWICAARATTPPPKRQATLRVALKLAWGFVAQSVEYRWGYTPSFAPRPRPISAQRMYSYFGDTTLGPSRINGSRTSPSRCCPRAASLRHGAIAPTCATDAGSEPGASHRPTAGGPRPRRVANGRTWQNVRRLGSERNAADRDSP